MRYILTTLADSDCAVGQVATVDTRDVLSYPTADDLLASALALLPVGQAWGTPDGASPPPGSVRAKLWTGILRPVADVFNIAFGVALEARAGDLSDSIDDWEADLGLPDTCAADPELPATIPEDAWFVLTDETGAAILAASGDPLTVDDIGLWSRKRAVRAKVRAAAVMRPADYVCLAWSMGYEIELFEHDTFRCGDLCGEELGPAWAEWAVNFVYWHPDMPGGFKAGQSECGGDEVLGEVVDPAAFPFPQDLKCIIESVIPVETARFYTVPLGTP